MSMAVLKVNANPTAVTEWNLFGHPSAAPAVPTTNFIQAHDGTVDLFWNHVGAKSYTIKRSTTAGGPYTTIKTGVTESSYADLTVTNNTTYYYVVSSVNEAGESANSSEKTVTPHASNYTGGLLDRKPLGFGSTVVEPPSTIKRETTDNNITTSLYVRTGEKLFYTFSNAVDIHSSIVSFLNSAPILEFYDDNNNLLLAYTPIASGAIEGLPMSVNNVKSVVLRYNTTTNKHSVIDEWNLFGEDHATAPAAPLNLTAVGGDKKVSLSWSAVNNTTSYTIKRSLTAGGPYTVLTTVSTATTSYIDSAVTNGTTYYYVVTADNATGSSAHSNEASAMPSGIEEPQEPPVENEGTRALLRIMLMTGEMKEYDVSMSVVDAFIGWYELRASGTGPITFAIDKSSNNIGPFVNRKDYIIFDKIITFEVNAYNINTGSSSEL
ncbi:fibronectin type III domain-containing protein [Paenibacillus harenae]|uniref:fibronectin type III domain-containing protein n=1 Tax=Paenibacillus harenae TaxID=306543 RepID=UPI0027D86E81|nr:fibronectin type III domain-containing protein [Paenibacillus harenae]